MPGIAEVKAITDVGTQTVIRIRVFGRNADISIQFERQAAVLQLRIVERRERILALQEGQNRVDARIALVGGNPVDDFG